MRPLRSLALLLAGAASACAGFNVGSDEGCVDVCATAYTCGFLPSGLGYDDEPALATADCERRCGQTPRDDPQISQLRGCLDGSAEVEGEVKPWCDDTTDERYADGVTCATAALCLARAFEGSQLLSDVVLKVRLISFDDYSMYFAADALTSLYDRDPQVVSSCEPALCGELDCMHRDDDDAPPCDPSMCGKGKSQTAEICDDLQLHTVELLVQERGSPPAVQVLADETTARACSEPQLEFGSADYLLHPGPVQTFARITGELPVSELRKIDYPVGDALDTDVVDYCLLFVGMNVTLRGGENLALVPFATVAEIAASAAVVRPIFCE